MKKARQFGPWSRRMALMVASMMALAALAPLGGCGLKKPPADKRQFVLDVTRPSGGAGREAADRIRLNVGSVRVSPLYESPGFVYRKKDGSFEKDFHNEFFSTPGYVLTEELRQWLSGAPFVEQIVDGASLEFATHVLRTRVNALYGDYTAAPPRAVMELEFTLQVRGGAPEIVFHRIYGKAVPAEGDFPDALVRAWTSGLEEILKTLEADLGAAGL